MEPTPESSVTKAKPMTHRDQIHGDVKFDPMAVALLNTDVMQRLGRVYQLGYSHLVYRGGTHTRLSHVMGAKHASNKLVDSLRQNYSHKSEFWPLGAIAPDDFLPFPGKELDDRWDFVRHICGWAALLHDVGHIPLSHTLEDEFEKLYPKHDDFRSVRLAYLWAETTPGLASEIRALLSTPSLYPDSFRRLSVTPDQVYGAVLLSCLHKEESAAEGPKRSFSQVIKSLDDESVIHRLLKKAWVDAAPERAFSPYFADVVGDTICADYLDYLRRDPTNVGLDVLKDDRVISRFYIGKEESEESGLYRMALSLVDRNGRERLDTCTGVIDLVRQRFRFAEIIYYHKTKVSASAMFAKAIKLIGKPTEVGPKKETISISEVQHLREQVLKDPSEVAALKTRMYPRDLLDPEIGDESLNLLMQQRGWENLEQASRDRDRIGAERCLRGLALLQSIARRRLYKTCFVVNEEAITNLMGGAASDIVERRIKRILTELRNEGKGDANDPRTKLEAELVAAAGWPDDALILYVPNRKSQAKGIETYALQANTVVTLEKHPAVQKKVVDLNEDYKKLWRLILLINPDPAYLGDAVGLSKALDILVRRIITIAERRTETVDFRPEWEETITSCSRLKYVPAGQRVAAQVFSELSEVEPTAWQAFEEVSASFQEREYSCDSMVHAGLAYCNQSIAGFPLAHAVDQVINAKGLARQLEAIFVDWSARRNPGTTNITRQALQALGGELADLSAASTFDNVVPLPRTRDDAAVQHGLELTASNESIPLAARTTSPEQRQAEPEGQPANQRVKTSSDQVTPDDQVFAAVSGLNRSTKTWKDRFDVLRRFLQADDLGSMEKNREFVEFVEKQFETGRSRTHVYSVEELRRLFSHFNQR